MWLFTAFIALFHSVTWSVATVQDDNGFDADSNLLDRHLQRIAGGENATEDEFPWFGRTIFSLETSDGSRSSACSASLIHSDIVMSAAVCVVPFINNPDVTSISVTFNLGGNLRDGSDITLAYQVSDVYWPRNFRYPRPDNDIVFYMLVIPTVISTENLTSVAPVTWNTDPSITLLGDVGTVVSYGSSTREGPFSPFLLKVDLTAISTAECRENFLPFISLIEKSMVCARAEGKGICLGDAGAPILTPDGAIYGLGSFFNNQECNQSTSVFTRVSSFSDMIDSIICDYSSSPPSPCNGFARPNEMRTYKAGEPIQCGIFGITFLCRITAPLARFFNNLLVYL